MAVVVSNLAEATKQSKLESCTVAKFVMKHIEGLSGRICTGTWINEHKPATIDSNLPNPDGTFRGLFEAFTCVPGIEIKRINK